MQKRDIETLSSDRVPPPVARVSRDEEISLIDLWLVLRRRWLWLLAGLLVGVIAAIGYATLTAPTYESRASIHVGKVHGSGLIEDLDTLTAQLTDQYGSGLGPDAQEGMPYLKQVTKAPGQSNILRLIAVGRSPEAARDFLAQVSAALIQRHEQLYKSAMSPLERRFAVIDRSTKALAAQISELDELITRLKESQPVQASLIAIERSDVYARLDLLERDRLTLQQQITESRSMPSRLIAPVTLPVGPVAPRQSVSAAIGIVLGLVLGLLAALSREFLAHMQTVTGLDTRSRGKA